MLIDISVPLHEGLPVWPDGNKYSTKLTASIPAGDICNVTQIELGAHMGTHIDAPLHFIDGAATTDTIPLEQMNGPCYAVELPNLEKITASDLQKAAIPSGVTRLLLKTDNSNLWKNLSHPFYKDFCALSADAATYLVDLGISLVGIDYLSISAFHDPPEVVHQILLSKDIVILETINLLNVSPGFYELICLPLKIQGVEGNPTRAVLRTI